MEDATANNFELKVDGPAAAAPYRFVFSVGNFKIVPGDYTVQISSKLISKWQHATQPIYYFIALETSSNYGG